MMNRFKSKKAKWWAAGVAAMLVGFLVYSVLVPNLVAPYGSDAPDIHVPKMRNLPQNSDALQLDVPDQPKQPTQSPILP